MAWIESHQEVGRHPKTKRAARALNVSLPTMVGHIHFLWWWAVDFAEDGNLDGFSYDEIAEAAMWEGDPETFINALLTCGIDGGPGYLEMTDGRLALHDWEEYAGKLVDQRKANAERQRRYRERHRNQPVTQTTDKRNVERNSYVTPTSPLRNSATGPDRTGPDMTTTYVVAPVPAEENAADAAPLRGDREPTEAQKMWTALRESLGYEPHKDNKAERGKWNGAIRSLINVGETAATLPDLVRRYRERWPDVDCTPTALVSQHSVIRSPLPSKDARSRASPSRAVDRSELSGATNQLDMYRARLERERKEANGVHPNPPKGDT